MKPAFLLALLGNEAQIQIHSSTRRLGKGGSFSSFSVQHSGSYFTKAATKVLNAKFNLLSLRQVLAEPARNPHLTHLTSSSSDELPLSSSTASIISLKNSRNSNITLTVKNSSIGTRNMTTLKKISSCRVPR